MKEKAYITLCSNDAYLLPCLVLLKSWQRTNSLYNFYIVVTEHVNSTSISILEQCGYKIIREQYYRPSINNTSSTAINQIGWQNLWNKFSIWKHEEFEKLLYIDADSIILQNMDELLDKPHMAAVENFVAPFAGSLFVLQPSKKEFDALIHFIDTFPNEEHVTMQDEYILTHYFADWQQNYELRLPCYWHKDVNTFSFNWWMNNWNKVKAIHYAGSCKPWLFKDRKSTIEATYRYDNFMMAFWFNVYYELLNQCLKELEDKDISLMFNGLRY